MPYTTKQRQAVLRFLEEHPEESFTAGNIARSLRAAGDPVGLATVYRQLERLEEAGRVHRVTTEEGALYRYCTAPSPGGDCFLLRCLDCGRIYHLDCAHLRELCRHLEADHGFSVDPRRTAFSGLCAGCAGGERAHGL